MPPLARAAEGRPLSSRADSTKYAARPIPAPRPHSTPTGWRPPSPVRSRTKTRPRTAAAEPATVSRRGRWPCATHIQATTRMMPRYSSSSATPIGRYLTALKKHACAVATASSPNNTIVPRLWRTTCDFPRSAHAAGTASTRAATPTRMATAASADQPASINERANVPEVANVAADSRAKPRPAPVECRWGMRRLLVAGGCHRQSRTMLMTIDQRVTGVKMVFAHDTEVGLAATVALVNTAGRDRDELPDVPALDAFFRANGWTGRHDHSEAELRSVRKLRPRLRRIWHEDEDGVVEIVNGLLRESNALPQLVKHDDEPYHLHATPRDAPLAVRMAVEAAMAFVDVVRNGELSRLRFCEYPDCENVIVD